MSKSVHFSQQLQAKGGARNNLKDQLELSEKEQKINKLKKKNRDLKTQMVTISKELDSEKTKNAMLMNILHDLKHGITQIQDIDFFLSDMEGISPPPVTNIQSGTDDFATQQLIKQLLSEETNNKKEELESEELIKRLIEEDKKRLQEELDKKRYQCLICDEEYIIEYIYVLDNCNHRYCLDCLGQMLKTKIKDGRVQEIKCPSPNCGSQIDYNQIKQIVRDDDLFAKYEEFNLKKTLESIPDLRWCPRPGCGNAMIGSSDVPMMICSNDRCRFTFCFKCKEEWHADVTCEQYQQWKIENSESESRYIDWVRNNTRQCPKCKTPIEKNGGCNHMTCKHCKHEFCWLCYMDYTSSHWETSSCTQYS